MQSATAGAEDNLRFVAENCSGIEKVSVVL